MPKCSWKVTTTICICQWIQVKKCHLVTTEVVLPLPLCKLIRRVCTKSRRVIAYSERLQGEFRTITKDYCLNYASPPRGGGWKRMQGWLTTQSNCRKYQQVAVCYCDPCAAGLSTDSEEASALLGTSTSISSTGGAPCSSAGVPAARPARPPLRGLGSYSSDSAASGSGHHPASSARQQSASTAETPRQLLSPHPIAGMRLTVARPGALRNRCDWSLLSSQVARLCGCETIVQRRWRWNNNLFEARFLIGFILIFHCSTLVRQTQRIVRLVTRWSFIVTRFGLVSNSQA